MLEALLSFHNDQNLAHQDIKLANFVLTDDFKIALIDFAHSCPLQEVRGVICGTPSHIAPPEIYNICQG